MTAQLKKLIGNLENEVLVPPRLMGKKEKIRRPRQAVPHQDKSNQIWKIK